MNADTEKLCMEEIDHLVLDNDKKVTVTHISNNWSSLTKDSVAVLEKWLKNNSSNKQITKEYLIRGTDLNGNSFITIVPESKLPKVEKVCPNHTRTLYSVEVSSVNGRSLNIPEPATNKFITLKIKPQKRNVKVNPIVVPPTEKSVKKEPEVAKKSSNIFGAAQSKPQQKEVKTEKDSEKSSKDVKVKEEKRSPTKSSPKKNQPAKGVKAPPGIASFFASKPSSSKTANVEKSVTEATAKIENVKIKEETAESKIDETKNNSKRSHSNVSDSNDEVKSSEKNQKTQAKKKMKLEPKSARSRLMQICDSSSDEEDSSERKETAMETDEETVVKKEKENKTPSPKKFETNQASSTGDSKKRRAKVKKMVTRTYEDEDGFINTVRELEEVSCSEEEPEAAAPPPKKAASTTNNSSSTASKKKISPPVGKKQGSILSFFGKK